MNKLEQTIKNAAQAYYTDGSSVLSDDEFDALVEELREVNPESKILKTGWGYDTRLDSTPGAKTKHLYGEAGSLEKCHDWKELGEHLRNAIVDVSLKLDGLSVVLYYHNGHLVSALTRGDGRVGIDITDKVIYILPSTELVNLNFTGAIRGEILMPLDKFKHWFQLHPEAKNPRNSTAGIINSKNWTVEDLSYLKIVVYSITGESSTNYIGCGTSTADMRNLLIEWFGESNVVPCMFNRCFNLCVDDMIDVMSNYQEMFDAAGYPSDGIVITDNTLIKHLDTGEIVYNSKAFKFPSEAKICTVVDVEWNMSKTRYAIPKIHIQPVELAGTTVEYCTGYNAQYIKDNNIGPGTRVLIQKRGEIIPNVDAVIESTSAQTISHCPDCGQPLSLNGVHLQCTNEMCSNAVIQDTLAWINNIAPRDGLGDTLIHKMLLKLVDGKVLKDLSVESIMESNLQLRTDTNSAQQNEFAKMWEELHTCKVSAVDALLALNIPRVGGVTAIKLSTCMDLLWDVADGANQGYTHISEYARHGLEACVKSATTQAIEDNMWKVNRLNYFRYRMKSDNANNTNKGKVAITGKLSVNRSTFEKELNAAGYTLGDISKDTKFLITDNPDSNSSKNQKADKLNITKITEMEFRNLYM